MERLPRDWLSVSRPVAVEEKADGGDAGGSGGDAGRSVFEGDSAEGEDGDGVCVFDGESEGFEAGAGEWVFAGDGFFKDRCEEDERVGRGCVRVPLRLFLHLENFFAGMAGVAEDGVASSAGEEVAGALGCDGERIGGQMDAVGSSVECNVWGAVEEDAGGLIFSADGGDDVAGEFREIGRREIFFPDLDVVDAVSGPGAGEFDERDAAIGFMAAEQASVGDGVKLHPY